LGNTVKNSNKKLSSTGSATGGAGD